MRKSLENVGVSYSCDVIQYNVCMLLMDTKCFYLLPSVGGKQISNALMSYLNGYFFLGDYFRENIGRF